MPGLTHDGGPSRESLGSFGACSETCRNACCGTFAEVQGTTTDGIATTAPPSPGVEALLGVTGVDAGRFPPPQAHNVAAVSKISAEFSNLALVMTFPFAPHGCTRLHTCTEAPD